MSGGGMGVVCGPGLPPLPFCLRPSSRHVTPRPRACAGRLAAVAVSGLRGPERLLRRRRRWRRPGRSERRLGGLGPSGAGAAVFSLAEGLGTPAAERRDEFPPRGDGGPECRTPAHRSRDGERSARGRAGTGLGPGWSRTGRPRRSLRLPSPARTRELPTRRAARAVVTGGLRGPGSPTDRGPSLFPFNLSAGLGAGCCRALEGWKELRSQLLAEGVWLRIKRYSWGHKATCSRPSGCTDRRLLRVGGSDSTFEVHPNVSCGNTCLARCSDLRSNHSRDFTALLVTQFLIFF